MLFNFKIEIGRTVADVKTGRIKKDSANRKLDNLLDLKNNDVFKGEKRAIKKEIFNAKKFIKTF